jgi:hypothetical protein
VQRWPLYVGASRRHVESHPVTPAICHADAWIAAKVSIMEDRLGIGIAIGTAVGAALGVATDNLALWLSLGIAIGAAIAHTSK